MTTTENLELPYMMPSQAQKHVTLNEALRMLDALVQLSVETRTLSEPPPAPVAGSRYIVGASPTGAWAGSEGAVAAFQDGAWAFLAPKPGWIVFATDEARLLVHQAGGWTPFASVGEGAGGQETSRLGINTEPDPSNRLAIKADSVLFTHDDATPGSGDMRHVVNKASAPNTASLLFQTGFSGRGEIGLSGNDDLAFKVSPDGIDWRAALIADRASGRLAVPAGFAPAVGPALVNLLANPTGEINQRGFAGGALAAGSYGPDRWKASAGGANLTIAAGAWSLVSGAIIQIVDGIPTGVRSVAVSVADPTADLEVTFHGAIATIAAGSGRRHVSFAFPSDLPPTAELRLAAPGGAVGYRDPQVQLGEAAFQLPGRNLVEEMSRCRWYFEKWTGNAFREFALGFTLGATVFWGFLTFTPKRVIPTIASGGAFRIRTGGNYDVTSISSAAVTKESARLVVDLASPAISGQAGLLSANNDASAYLQASSEL